MPTSTPDGSQYTWLIFALMTVVTWGLYGIFLHGGQMAMADSQTGRYKAFLFVGFAYCLTAVIAPFIVLWFSGADWHFWQYPPKGIVLS